MSEQLLSIWKGPIAMPSDTIRECIELAADNHNITVTALKSQCRIRKIAWARQEACWRLRNLTYLDGRPRLSFPRIAQLVGLTDHTTVIHAVRAHAKRNGEETSQCLGASRGEILAQ